MTKLDEYMQAPSVVNEPMPLREVHAIRLMIYDDIKGMTPEEVSSYYMRGFEELKKQYNFKFTTLSKRYGNS